MHAVTTAGVSASISLMRARSLSRAGILSRIACAASACARMYFWMSGLAVSSR
jgi:hypothetical protein